MKMQKYQRGISLYVVFFWVLLLVIAAHTTFKVLPVYMTDMKVKSVIEGLNKDPDASYRNVADVQRAITRRLEVNQVRGLGRDEITIVRQGQIFNVSIVYEETVPYIANISLLFNFAHHTEVNAR